MRYTLVSLCFVVALIGVAGCSSSTPEQTAAPAPTAAAASAKPALNIKPFGTGDANFKPDYSKLDPQLAKTFTISALSGMPSPEFEMLGC